MNLGLFNHYQRDWPSIDSLVKKIEAYIPNWRKFYSEKKIFIWKNDTENGMVKIF